jgi:GntR family transcriptional regulator, transcriptional repressor for pyruvate dehydrogenase complex
MFSDVLGDVKTTRSGNTRVKTMSLQAGAGRARPRSLALEVVDALGDRIRQGQWVAGARLPTESEVMAEFGVSRTVVREALSRLQAAGLVATRHGVGSFVVGPAEDAAFRIGPHPMQHLRDVVAVLELRIGVETEAAALAAQRRTDANLRAMRAALAEMAAAVEAGGDAVAADFQFHHEIARATQNAHYAGLMQALGPKSIPRARLDDPRPVDPERLTYLRRVNHEHETILDAIMAADVDAARAAMRTHLVNSRERRRRALAEGAG